MSFKAVACGLAVALLTADAAPAQAPKKGMVLPPAATLPAIEWIDVHLHTIARTGAEADTAARQALTAMDEAHVSRAIVLPTPQAVQDYNAWDYTVYRDTLRKYPARFAFLAGGGTLNALIQTTSPDRAAAPDVRDKFAAMAEHVLADGAVGFGEIAAHHLSLTAEHPYEWVPADHPLLLLLADIAARRDVPIDLHFDVVSQDVARPDGLTPPNPAVFKANLPAFERLLAHNRGARIVWAHAGSDIVGQWTVELSRALLARHPNLFMSLRMGPGRVWDNHPLTPAGELKEPWLHLLQEFPDRFVLGTDQFFVGNPKLAGPAAVFAQRAQANRLRTRLFLATLPAELATRIATENARRIYKLDASAVRR